jgi:tRNA(Arg) A34 adenosine deaminase TadA
VTEDARVRVDRAADLAAAERVRHERLHAPRAGAGRAQPEAAVRRGAFVAEAVNAVEVSPLLHGDTAAIDACARTRGGRDTAWPSFSLYTTAEPCPMCAAAIAWTGIGEVIVGTDTPTLARLGIDQIHLGCADVLAAAPFYRGRMVTGILAAETDRMYADWARTLVARGS